MKNVLYSKKNYTIKKTFKNEFIDGVKGLERSTTPSMNAITFQFFGDMKIKCKANKNEKLVISGIARSANK